MPKDIPFVCILLGLCDMQLGKLLLASSTDFNASGKGSNQLTEYKDTSCVGVACLSHCIRTDREYLFSG